MLIAGMECLDAHLATRSIFRCHKVNFSLGELITGGARVGTALGEVGG